MDLLNMTNMTQIHQPVFDIWRLGRWKLTTNTQPWIIKKVTVTSQLCICNKYILSDSNLSIFFLVFSNEFFFLYVI